MPPLGGVTEQEHVTWHVNRWKPAKYPNGAVILMDAAAVLPSMFNNQLLSSWMVPIGARFKPCIEWPAGGAGGPYSHEIYHPPDLLLHVCGDRKYTSEIQPICLMVLSLKVLLLYLWCCPLTLSAPPPCCPFTEALVICEWVYITQSTL